MPRAMWTGAISFGMVTIPVKMYKATEERNVSFRLLCPCHSQPIKMNRSCAVNDEVIPWSDPVRGYEIGKNEFVMISDEELAAIPVEARHTIDIVEFCKDTEISSIYYGNAYFLQPDAVASKAYSLLCGALNKSRKVAIGKVTLRTRERLCRLSLYDGQIMMTILSWPDEIRSNEELAVDTQPVHKNELAMAVELIENLTAVFDPAAHHDAYREQVLDMIEDKLNGPKKGKKKAVVKELAPAPDLMAAMKASIEARKRA